MKLSEILTKNDLIERYDFKRQLFGGGTYSRNKLTSLGKKILEASTENLEKGIYGIYSNHCHELEIDDVKITIQVIDDGEFDTPFQYEIDIQKIEPKSLVENFWQRMLKL